ncbi:DUF6345 domain-containing protein [Chloroflexota bacterium]
MKLHIASILLALLLAGGMTVFPMRGTPLVSAGQGEFPSKSTDGSLYAWGWNYSAAHNASSGTVYDWGPNIPVGQDFLGDPWSGYFYTVYRGGLLFDTSSIPSDATIVSACLSLYVRTSSYLPSDFLIVVSGADLNDPMTSSDYGQLLDETSSKGDYWIPYLDKGEYNDIYLNPAGISEISKTGTTKFGLRTLDDILGVAPGYGSERVDFSSYEGGNAPKLEITYYRDDNDEASPEVGIQWIETYREGDDCDCSQSSAEGFYNALGQAGWTKSFNYHETLAWEKHLKRDDPGWNGEDHLVGDTVDILFWEGHGGIGMLRFDNKGQDDEYLKQNTSNPDGYPGNSLDEARWGDLDLEWIFLPVCYPLGRPGWKGQGEYAKNLFAFGPALNGAHLICGAITHVVSWPDGVNIANYLLGWGGQNKRPVLMAYFLGMNAFQGGNVELRVIGENQACGNDYIWGQGYVSPDPVVDNLLYVWDYRCY